MSVDVEMVVLPESPDDSYLESETVNFLKEVQERAERGDVEWLKQHGRVYVALDAELPAASRGDERKS
ncbi:MAG TPA: hypothetical protein VGE52_11680 [Pirellulales bacterium]